MHQMDHFDYPREVMGFGLHRPPESASNSADSKDVQILWVTDEKVFLEKRGCNATSVKEFQQHGNLRGVVCRSDGSIAVTDLNGCNIYTHSTCFGELNGENNIREIYSVTEDARTKTLYMGCGQHVGFLDEIGGCIRPLEIYEIVDGEKLPAVFECAMGVAMHPSGDLYVADYDAHALWRVDLQTKLRHKIGISSTTHTNGLHYPAALSADITGRIFIAEWDGARIWCVDSRPMESSFSPNEVRQAAVVAKDFECAGIALDQFGQIYSANRDGIMCLVPDSPQPPSFDAVRLGLCELPKLEITSYGRHLLSLNDIKESRFALQVSPSLRINNLPLLNRFTGASPDAMERFLSHIRDEEAVFVTSDVLTALLEWIYADALPRPSWASAHGNGRKTELAQTIILEKLFRESGLKEHADYCAHVVRITDPETGYSPTLDDLKRKPPSCLSKSMLDLLESGLDADFFILCLGSGPGDVAQTIPCHSDILRARWPFFKTLIGSGFAESSGNSWRVRQWGDPDGGLSPETVLALLRYFYSDQYDFIDSISVALQILAMREYYLLETEEDSSHSAMLQHCEEIVEDRSALSSSEALLVSKWTADVQESNEEVK